MRAEKEAREEAERNQPFETAVDMALRGALEEGVDTLEISIEPTSDLKVWSSHYVEAVKQMLYEQQEIEEDRECDFRIAGDDEEEVELLLERLGIAESDDLDRSTKIQDLLPHFPPRDQDGQPDNVNVPEVTLKVRFKLKVCVEILTHPEVGILVYHLPGSETITELEDMIFNDLTEKFPEIDVDRRVSSGHVTTRRG